MLIRGLHYRHLSREHTLADAIAPARTACARDIAIRMQVFFCERSTHTCAAHCAHGAWRERVARPSATTVSTGVNRPGCWQHSIRSAY
jgi:hypothetical protein